MLVLKFSEHTVRSHMVPLLLNLKDTAESMTLKTNFSFATSDHRAALHITSDHWKWAWTLWRLQRFSIWFTLFSFPCLSFSLSLHGRVLTCIYGLCSLTMVLRIDPEPMQGFFFFFFTIESSVFWKITAIQSWFVALFCTMQLFLWALCVDLDISYCGQQNHWNSFIHPRLHHLSIHIAHHRVAYISSSLPGMFLCVLLSCPKFTLFSITLPIVNVSSIRELLLLCFCWVFYIEPF